MRTSLFRNGAKRLGDARTRPQMAARGLRRRRPTEWHHRIQGPMVSNTSPTRDAAAAAARAATAAADDEFNGAHTNSGTTQSLYDATNPGTIKLSHIADERIKPWHINLGRDDGLNGARPESWWTGPNPANMTEAQGRRADGSITSLPLPDLRHVTRQGARDYFDNTWVLTEMLLGGLQGEEAFFGPCYHELRHPLIFYLGHVAALYINKAVVAGLLPECINKELEDKFEVGVDEMSWDDLGKNDEIWPTVTETQAYRRIAYKAVCDLIDREFDDTPRAVTWDDPMWALFMGCEHERIHLETSSVLMRELPVRLMRRPEHWPRNHESETATAAHPPRAGVDYPDPQAVAIEGREITLGKPKDFPSYGWDNVYGDKQVAVASFEASQHLVSNGEYWQFVQEGGYRSERFWCKLGWEWRSFRNRKWPGFWVTDGPEGSHRYALRNIFEELPMQWSWPVDVTAYEANAFCAWKREKNGNTQHVRLPTEAEVNAMRDVPVTDGEPAERDHILRPSAEVGAMFNINLEHGSQSAVDAKPKNQKGLNDVFGNVWQHALDEMKPIDDSYEVHPYYDDFTAPCFDGQHHLILGGSFISTGEEASTFARYHFRPHFQQHAGFRTVNNTADRFGEATINRVSEGGKEMAAMGGAFERKDMYEDQGVVDSYMLLHYGTEEDTFAPHGVHEGAPTESLYFPQRCAAWLAGDKPGGTALDVGCAVGGASAALSAHYDSVTGIDLSEAFIAAANRVADNAARGLDTDYSTYTEGRATLPCVAQLPPGSDLSRNDYYVGDACHLLATADSLPAENAADLSQKFEEGFDAVLMANLLCRLPDPEACLRQMQSIVKPGGRLAITTPFTWLDTFTPTDKWLGGREGAADSFEGMQAVLEGSGFELTDRRPMPLLIRETSRKFQYIVADGTIWTRKE